MPAKLKQQPFYLLLLPVFFVLHGYVENFGFINAGDLAILAVTYLVATITIAFLFWLLFRNIAAAALAAFVLMSFYFFFGALHDFLKIRAPWEWISSYSFLLAAFPILFIILLFYLKKTTPSLRLLTVFLNVLFLVYMLVDATSVVSKAINPVKDNLSVYSFAKNNNYKICDTCAKPDIYFLLMDEYASSLALKQLFNYNNDLDSFLLNRNFSIQTHSRSNYNFTPFSMASMLNMSYIEGLKNVQAVDGNDYARCQLLIKNNEVIKLLSATGYDIVNYSVFDLAGHPTILHQSLLPFNTMLITERTLFSNMKKDIGWKLVKWYPFKWLWTPELMYHKINNDKLINLVKQSAGEKNNRPRFIYAHFFMPHIPFYYDKNGRLRDVQTISNELDHPSISAYLDYLTYANSQIKSMIAEIQHKKHSAIIILMGDHGYRNNTPPPRCFQNLNAVYFPDKDYRLLYDSISCVNQYRVIFNKLFSESLPVLKDSSVYLKDKKIPSAMN